MDPERPARAASRRERNRRNAVRRGRPALHRRGRRRSASRFPAVATERPATQNRPPARHGQPLASLARVMPLSEVVNAGQPHLVAAAPTASEDPPGTRSAVDDTDDHEVLPLVGAAQENGDDLARAGPRHAADQGSPGPLDAPSPAEALGLRAAGTFEQAGQEVGEERAKEFPRSSAGDEPDDPRDDVVAVRAESGQVVPSCVRLGRVGPVVPLVRVVQPAALTNAVGPIEALVAAAPRGGESFPIQK